MIKSFLVTVSVAVLVNVSCAKAVSTSALLQELRETFQGYYYFDYYGADPLTRDIFIDHPYYNWTVAWCEDYDQASFDPDYPSLPLVQLLPVVKRVLARAAYWWNPSHSKAGAVSSPEETRSERNYERKSAKVVCQDTWTCH
jgi:hypothetical protein